jgi:polyisoprenoid-binding protein YceI
MGRRARLAAIGAAALIVVVAAGGYAALRLTGGDAPPPPALARGDGELAALYPGPWHVVRAPGAFAGYRVDERYLGVGGRTAVGRTPAVRGRVRISGGRIVAARLGADLRELRSDKPGRDRALRSRAIETDRYPRARFRLGAPVALSGAERRASGTLELHGRTAPVTVALRAARRGQRLELVGRAGIRFAAFRIDPPSVAGLVTVSDRGLLEFRLVLARG